MMSAIDGLHYVGLAANLRNVEVRVRCAFVVASLAEERACYGHLFALGNAVEKLLECVVSFGRETSEAPTWLVVESPFLTMKALSSALPSDVAHVPARFTRPALEAAVVAIRRTSRPETMAEAQQDENTTAALSVVRTECFESEDEQEDAEEEEAVKYTDRQKMQKSPSILSSLYYSKVSSCRKNSLKLSRIRLEGSRPEAPSTLGDDSSIFLVVVL